MKKVSLSHSRTFALFEQLTGANICRSLILFLYENEKNLIQNLFQNLIQKKCRKRHEVLRLLRVFFDTFFEMFFNSISTSCDFYMFLVLYVQKMRYSSLKGPTCDLYDVFSKMKKLKGGFQFFQVSKLLIVHFSS